MIERLDEEQWERLARIRLDALRTDPDAFGSSIAREEGFGERQWRMRLRSSAWFVARDDAGDDVGLVCAIQEPGADDAERHVVSLWVRPQARRGGVAQRLLDAVAGLALQEGAERLTLWQIAGNDAAARACLGAGFAPTGATMPLPRDPARTEQRWSRPLGAAR
ncbi:N-acetyltransferase [Actinotalea sp. JY-7885]|uniref:GNAT family N-acetyltransferase n=1 Tax=Actinotalea sp. JY-7885 TaxID=2758576 RepID=UPI002107234D|nr:GNAT family N-acetyltransferase [Actinotalea sp. JY-7885]